VFLPWPPQASKVEEVSDEMAKALAQAEALGEEGKVEESLKLMGRVEELKRLRAQADVCLAEGGLEQRRPASPSPTSTTFFLFFSFPHLRQAEYREMLPPGAERQQKLRACDDCGLFLSLFDNDRRCDGC
jgi:hypothetical protein